MGEKIIKQKIIEAIRGVPPGEVSSYGRIAAQAGYPGRARLVARLLSESDQPELPWHRILRTNGQIAFPPDSAMFAEQARRLRAEGVTVVNGRVKMPKAALDLDALLWSPR